MIIIDTREQHRDYISNVFESNNVKHCISGLSHGMDYMLVGKATDVGIQRKSGSAEIPKQMKALRHDILPALKQLTTNPILLIEEDFVIGQDGQFYRRQDSMLRSIDLDVEAYFNFIHSIKKIGVDVVTTRNLDASIWWLIATHRYIQQHHYPKVDKLYEPKMQAVGCLCAINSFGQSTSKRLLKSYTLKQLFEMDDLTLKRLMDKDNLYNFEKVRNVQYED